MKMIYQAALFFTFLFSASGLLCGQTSESGEKGIEAYNQGQYQQAVEILQNVVEANKKDEAAWLYLGMSLARLKNSSGAKKALNRAARLIDNKKVEAPAGSEREAKIISKPRATYTDDARRNQNQGIIKLAVEFGADGQIKGVFPFQTLPNGLTENCVRAAKEIKFEPAVKDGKSVSSIKIVAYSFTIY